MSKQERELPYEFDLFYDIKTMKQVQNIAEGKPDCSDAEPEDLVTLFNELELEVPECLKSFNAKQTIWILPNGTWLDYEPLKDEHPNARKTVIEKF